MGSARKNTKAKPQPQLRSRTTRSSKGRLLDSASPALSGALLDDQLRGLGLYAANTVGDGNCLFRALSDQLYGSPSRHFELRGQVCDWIQRHRERYEPFVEDERGLETHLRCMREHGTYGGHMELSAFAHLTRRNVKVIQPGLVYVIEWEAFTPTTSTSASYAQNDDDDEYAEDEDDGHEYEPPITQNDVSDRDRRHRERERAREKDKNKVKPKGKYAKKASTKREPSPVDDSEREEDEVGDTIYVAYHDWEHFSSIRNLRGPHMGLPCVREILPPTSSSSLPASPTKKDKEKEKRPKVTLKLCPASPGGSSVSATNTSTSTPPIKMEEDEIDPTTVPLPDSRSASPFPSMSPANKAGTQAPHPLRASFLPGEASSSSTSSFLPVPALPPPPHSTTSSSVSLSSTAVSSASTPAPPSTVSSFSPSPSPSSGYSSSSSRAKRRHEESSGDGECEEYSGSDAGSKRSRRSSRGGEAVTSFRREEEELRRKVGGEERMDVDDVDDVDREGGTPALSSGVSTASSEEEVASSPEPEPEPEPEPDVVSGGKGRRDGNRGERPMTRRERKRLGLPKPNRMLGAGSAGKIVIPGGRFRRGGGVEFVDVNVKVEEGEGEGGGGGEEWRKNGTGRVDVRGFRELKI